MSNIENIEVVTYQQRYRSAFTELNREWIETHFALEAMDLEQLENPNEEILQQGGEIFFLLEGEHPAGTCAMIAHGQKCFELAKMAVAPAARGNGYGDVLMEFAIQWAKLKGAEKIILLSNTKLEPARSLYKKHGFVTTHLGTHPDYERCNIEMELRLESRS